MPPKVPRIVSPGVDELADELRPLRTLRPPDLISIAEAQAEFKVAPSTLYYLIDKRRITAHRRRAGRPRTFVDRRELRKLLEVRPQKPRKR